MKQKAKRTQSKLSWKHIALASACAFIATSASAGYLDLDLSYDGDATVAITWTVTADNAFTEWADETMGNYWTMAYGLGASYVDPWGESDPVISGQSAYIDTATSSWILAVATQWTNTQDQFVANTDQEFYIFSIDNSKVNYSDEGDSYTFVMKGADATSWAELSTSALKLANNGTIDAVSIPEPTTVSLLGAGVIVALGMHRHKSRNALPKK